MEALQGAARAYGMNAEAVPVGRVRALAGDITLPGCGAEEAGRADMLWHSAASLRYENRYEEEIRRTNITGTANVLALARRMGVEVANVFSTAYVWGRTEGLLPEEPIRGVTSNNHYERSKVDSEALLAGAEGLDVRVFRPSIVVGHSRTLSATAFTGLYGFVRQMYQFRRILERMRPGLYRTRPMQIRMTPDGEIDMIPVDAVAAQAVYIGLSSGASGIYHLTGTDKEYIGAAVSGILSLLGFAAPEYIDKDADSASLEWLDGQLDKQLDFYGSYILGRRVFERRRADQAIGARRDLVRPLPPIREMAAWYLERLEQERQNAPVTR